jgi:cytochrome c-type biogenesis protein CcmH
MRRTCTSLLGLVFMLLASIACANDAAPTLADPVTARREVELASQLRCLVCQNQSIAESNAGLAVDLRNQLREQIVAGKSDKQIVEYMTARYGDFVLYKPPFRATTALLWLGPALLLVIGAFIAARSRTRSMSRARPNSNGACSTRPKPKPASPRVRPVAAGSSRPWWPRLFRLRPA